MGGVKRVGGEVRQAYEHGHGHLRGVRQGQFCNLCEGVAQTS